MCLQVVFHTSQNGIELGAGYLETMIFSFLV